MPENKDIPVIFLACANRHRAESVVTLEEELSEIEALLRPMEEKRACTLIRERSEDNVYFVDMATQVAYRERIEIIHIAGGGAGRRHIRMESASGEVAMDTDEFTDLLAELPRLTLIFISGCATPRLVRKILTKTQAAVIRIDDDPRNNGVAREFYSNLAKGSIIKRSFGQATIQCGDHLMYEILSMAELVAPPFQRKDIYEGLYVRNDCKINLDWKLSPSFYILVDQDHLFADSQDYTAIKEETPSKISPWLKPLMAGLTSLMGVGLVLFSLFSQVPNRLVNQLAGNTVCPFPTGSNTYNILILPFYPENDCGREESGYKSAVREGIERLKEVNNMPINAQYHNALCPTSDFFANGVGGTCNANMVIWGTFLDQTDDQELVTLHFSTTNHFGEGQLLAEQQAPWEIRTNEPEELSAFVGEYLKPVVLWSEANKLYQKGLYQQAAEAFQQLATSFDEPFVSVEHRIAQSYAQLNLYDLAIIHYDKALALHPEQVDLLVERSRIHLANKSFKLAETDLNLALSYDPNSVNALLGKGKLYQQTALMDSALLEFNRAIVVAPDNAQTYLARGEQYMRMNEADAAMADFQRAIEKSPGNSDPYRAVGDLQVYLGQYQDAKASFEKAIALNPRDAKAIFELGKLEMRYARHEKALIYFVDAIEIDSRQAKFYSYRALAYQELGVDSTAEIDANKGVELAPQDCEVYAIRGQVRVDLRDYTLAGEDFDKALELDPECGRAYYGRGLLNEKLNNDDKALDNYTDAIRFDGNRAFAYCRRGQLYEQQTQNEKALADYTQAIQLDPNLSYAYDLRANLHLKMENLDLALTDYNNAIKRDNGLWSPYYSRGYLYVLKNNFTEAIKDINRSIELRKEGTGLHYQLLTRIYASQEKDSLFYRYLELSLQKKIPAFIFEESDTYNRYKSDSTFQELMEKYRKKDEEDLDT